MNDSQHDEELGMGEKALFIEHPTDPSNRIKINSVKSSELPWKDTQKNTLHYYRTLFEVNYLNEHL